VCVTAIYICIPLNVLDKDRKAALTQQVNPHDRPIASPYIFDDVTHALASRQTGEGPRNQFAHHLALD